MTANEMIPAVGMKVMVRFEEIEVVCIVCDVKTAWNKVRLQVTPELGNGSQWVEMPRVKAIAHEPMNRWTGVKEME